jgi:hypothetical protein
LRVLLILLQLLLDDGDTVGGLGLRLLQRPGGRRQVVELPRVFRENRVGLDLEVASAANLRHCETVEDRLR